MSGPRSGKVVVQLRSAQIWHLKSHGAKLVPKGAEECLGKVAFGRVPPTWTKQEPHRNVRFNKGDQFLYYREDFLYYGEGFLYYGEDFLYYGEDFLYYGEDFLYYGEDFLYYG